MTGGLAPATIPTAPYRVEHLDTIASTRFTSLSLMCGTLHSLRHRGEIPEWPILS